MSKCQVCDGRAQLYLCTVHEMILRDTLRDLPQWLEWLADAAVGNVRLGDNGRRGTRASELDEYAGPDGADKLAKALEDGKLRRDRLLAAGRVNAKASRLHDTACNTLTTWVRHLCETHAMQAWPPRHTVPLEFIGPLLPGWRRINQQAQPGLAYLARWLERRTHTIAGDEAAKECHDDMVDLTDRIKRVINRPPPLQFCGPCPTPLTEEQLAEVAKSDNPDRNMCMTRLYAKPKADTVICPTCDLEYNVTELKEWIYDEADEYSFTLVQLAHYVLPTLGHTIHHRTLQRRIRQHEIMPTGQRAHVPTYQLGQVREALRI